jgi:FAD:protein FMN transferase
VVPIRDRAIATSGDYRNFRTVDGTRLTHILDPRSGHPVHHALASVTVLDELAVRADALSTALMVMGPDAGMQFATERHLPVLFLIRRPDGSFEERASPAFGPSMAGPAMPTKETP